MTTIFVGHGGKVNTLLPINILNILVIKLIRNIITDSKNHTQQYENLVKKLSSLHHQQKNPQD